MLSRTDDWFWSCEIPPFCLELRFRKDMFFLPLVECYFHHKPWKSTVCLAFLRGCSLFPVVLFMTGQFCLWLSVCPMHVASFVIWRMHVVIVVVLWLRDSNLTCMNDGVVNITWWNICFLDSISFRHDYFYFFVLIVVRACLSDCVCVVCWIYSIYSLCCAATVIGFLQVGCLWITPVVMAEAGDECGALVFWMKLLQQRNNVQFRKSRGDPCHFNGYIGVETCSSTCWPGCGQ